MFGNYDTWKLATPPEYEEMGEPPREEDDEPIPATLRVPYSRPGMLGMRDHQRLRIHVSHEDDSD